MVRVLSFAAPGETRSEGMSVTSGDVNVIPRIGIVVPCYNEEEVLPETGRRLISLLQTMMTDGRVAAGSQVVFVDDGSRDRTWEMIEGMASSDTRVDTLPSGLPRCLASSVTLRSAVRCGNSPPS